MSLRRSEHFHDTGAVRLHYVSRGEGPLVLLLHGFPETHRSWELCLEPLASAGFRVVAPDLRGYGDSGWPRSGYDLDSLAGDVLALARHLSDEPFSVVGHDWGGAITWHLAAHHASALRHAVVLACPHPAAMADAFLHDRDQLRRSWYMFFFQLPRWPERWLTRRGGQAVARMFRDEPPKSAAVRQIVEAEVAALCRPGALHGPLAYYRTALRQGARDLAARTPPARVRMPVTLIWGERDSCLGLPLVERSRQLADDLTVHVLADTGHFLHQEATERVLELLCDALREGAPS